MATETPVAAPPATDGPGAVNPATASPSTEVPAHKEPFPPFDPTYFASQLLWFAITFVALYLILSKVAIPRIAGILASRRGRISGDLGAAEKAKSDSEAAGAAYEKALATARSGAMAIAEKAREEAKASSDAERKRIEADLAARLAASEAQIAEIKKRALAEVGSIATDAAGAVIGALSDIRPAAREIEDAVGAAMAGRAAGGV